MDPTMDERRAARHRASTQAVLGFAWTTETFGADQVISALGMTRSTALSALDELIDAGLVSELTGAAPAAGQRLGRPARRFTLRGDAGVVVGVDAGGRRFNALVADLAGRVLAHEQLDVADPFSLAHPDPADRRAAAIRVIDAALAAAGRARPDVVAVGVGLPAPVDDGGVSPATPSAFWQYMNADLHDALSRVFPLVRVENDAALAAVAEGTLGQARGREHFVAMLSGRRLGSGVFLGGRLVRGAHGGVGELEALSYVAGVGGTWGLGDLAEKWVRAAREDGGVPAGHPWARLAEESLTAEAILAEARLSDPVTAPLVSELGRTLGRVCSVIARFYDPEVIVVCGAVAAALGEVIEVAAGRVAGELELPPPAIVASGLGGGVVSLGAVAAAREAARDVVLQLLSERKPRK